MLKSLKVSGDSELLRVSSDVPGMVVRGAAGKVHILEALGGHGVYREEWHTFLSLGWHECYSHIVWRKVWHMEHCGSYMPDLPNTRPINRLT
eukprot:5906281-Amphidinium_carterae.1